MDFKFKYEDNEEKDLIISNNTNLFLIEEQNIIDGNFLIFSDIQPKSGEIEYQEIKELNERTSTISDYMIIDKTSIVDLENYILQREKNKTIGGII